MITILGLGPGSSALVTRGAWRAMLDCELLLLRTARHPCLDELPDTRRWHSFDALYEAHDHFEDVYAQIAQRVVAAAQQCENLVYAVPGDAMVGEATVPQVLRLAAERALPTELLPGISFIEPCLALLELDALDGIQIHDALEIAELYHPPLNPSLPALLAQVYSRHVASQLKLTLMNQYADDFAVLLVHAAGTPQARVEPVPLYAIDRSPDIDITTSLYLPPQGPLDSFEAAQNTIAHLRSEKGCAWDRKQTHLSLRPYLIEETYEVLECLDTEDPQALCEELGDLLLQVLLHVQIATDDGEFNMAKVLRQLNAKLIRRHPHVWGGLESSGDPEQLKRIWNEAKAAEKAGQPQPQASLLDGIPKAAPALFVAQRYCERAAEVGFDWQTADDLEVKLREELAEFHAAQSDEERAHEIGDIFFVLVNMLRWLGQPDAESLLRATNAKFYRRFRHVEKRAAAVQSSLSACNIDELDAWWLEAKQLGL